MDFIEKAVLEFSFHIQEKALSKLSWLSLFEDVYIFDASPIRLPAGLSNIFPGNRTNHSPACLKLSALYRLSVRSTEWVEFSAQKQHDSKFLPDLNQLKGSLFLFDLGYFSHAFLHQLCNIGVWFVCRLKANSVPIITKVGKGVAKRHIGRPLDKNVNLRGMIVEVWGKVESPWNKIP
ncbi:MAG: transposase [Deltaproteobacteria bacterium]|nr:transposase [Deltaproteobacteria bacterium]